MRPKQRVRVTFQAVDQVQAGVVAHTDHEIDEAGFGVVAATFPELLPERVRERLIAAGLVPLQGLDEAVIALDPESEAIFLANLSRIASGRTVIIVSHRLSTLVDAHAILVLQESRCLGWDVGAAAPLPELPASDGEADPPLEPPVMLEWHRGE